MHAKERRWKTLRKAGWVILNDPAATRALNEENLGRPDSGTPHSNRERNFYEATRREVGLPAGFMEAIVVFGLRPADAILQSTHAREGTLFYYLGSFNIVGVIAQRNPGAASLLFFGPGFTIKPILDDETGSKGHPYPSLPILQLSFGIWLPWGLSDQIENEELRK